MAGLCGDGWGSFDCLPPLCLIRASQSTGRIDRHHTDAKRRQLASTLEIFPYPIRTRNCHEVAMGRTPPSRRGEERSRDEGPGRRSQRIVRRHTPGAAAPCAVAQSCSVTPHRGGGEGARGHPPRVALRTDGWERLDSNQRRQSQRVYSPSPLTARARSQRPLRDGRHPTSPDASGDAPGEVRIPPPRISRRSRAGPAPRAATRGA